MPLSGHLSDLSLSELIEFFCNQRKSGQLRVHYPQGHGFFYLQSGSVVDAHIGVLRGIDAIYFALTLPNARFEFGSTSEPIERTINQPWTQVVLEGLRRLDEGVLPPQAFPAGHENAVQQPQEPESEVSEAAKLSVPTPASFISKESIGQRRWLITGVVTAAVLAIVAAVGLPAGWYTRGLDSAPSSRSVLQSSTSEAPLTTPTAEVSSEAVHPAAAKAQANEAELAAKRYRDLQRAKAREEKADLQNQSGAINPTTNPMTNPMTNPSTPRPTAPAPASPVAEAAKTGPKKVTVTVTYDESGRVVQASGGDASAVRIARQKRFPAGKAGSATITIPIN